MMMKTELQERRPQGSPPNHSTAPASTKNAASSLRNHCKGGGGVDVGRGPLRSPWGLIPVWKERRGPLRSPWGLIPVWIDSVGAGVDDGRGGDACVARRPAI